MINKLLRSLLSTSSGGSRSGAWMQIRNIFIIFIVSGFWHGANWTFKVWGALNAICFLPLLVFNKNTQHLDIVAKRKYLPTIKEFLSIGFTFSLTVFAWIFFRAENIGHACRYISEIFSSSLLSIPGFKNYTIIFLVLIFTIIEWIGRK